MSVSKEVREIKTEIAGVIEDITFSISEHNQQYINSVLATEIMRQIRITVNIQNLKVYYKINAYLKNMLKKYIAVYI